MPIQRITSGILANGAVVAADIADGIVTNAKLAGSITSDKITSVSNTAIAGLIQSAQIGSANASVINAGTLAGARLPAGSVLQVVSTQTTTQVSVTTTTPTSIGLSASITVSANSKVLVLTVVPWFESGTGTWSNAGTSYIFQNDAQVAKSEHTGTTTAEQAAWTNPLNYITGTLSAGTYTFEAKHGVTIGGTHVCMRDGRIGTIMLLEIAS